MTQCEQDPDTYMAIACAVAVEDGQDDAHHATCSVVLMRLPNVHATGSRKCAARNARSGPPTS